MRGTRWILVGAGSLTAVGLLVGGLVSAATPSTGAKAVAVWESLRAEVLGKTHKTIGNASDFQQVLTEPAWAKTVKQVPRNEIPNVDPMLAHMRPEPSSVWIDGSVPDENYRLWDELIVYSYEQGGTPTIATDVVDVITSSTKAKYEVSRVSPQAIGPVNITAVNGPSVSFATVNGKTTGSLNLWTGVWRFS